MLVIVIVITINNAWGNFFIAILQQKLHENNCIAVDILNGKSLKC